MEEQRSKRRSDSINFEAFYHVLPLLVETCGRLLLSLENSSSSNKSFSGEEKVAPAATKTLTSDGYLALHKTYYKDFVYMPFYRETKPPT